MVALANGGQLAALDPSIGRGEPDGLTAIASSAADARSMRSSATSRARPRLRCRRRRWSRPTGAPPPLVAARPPGTAVGYLLIDLETGQVLAELNPDLPLIPASTAKLATAVAALDVLGPEHRFDTELLARGA